MPSSRVADSTIKGFIYQFNKTILEILDSSTGTIHVEGIVEDVDVYDANNSIRAIQCKYHESAKSFTLSLIYKPIILMIKTFLERPNDDISFVLFIYVPSEEEKDLKLSVEDLESILKTEDQTLKKIITELNLEGLDKDKFLDHLVIRFGRSIEDLEDEIKSRIEGLDRFKGYDADGLIYPNLIAKIQKISSIKDHDSRKVKQQEIFDFLIKQSKVVINKWTLMTKSRNALLKKLRDDFRTDMSANSLSRCFIFKGFNTVEANEIAKFINTYVGKYLKKTTHRPASFIFDIEREKFNELVRLLDDQDIVVNDGMVGGVWRSGRFYKDCLIRKKSRSTITPDFHIRAQTIKQESFEIRKDFFHQSKVFGLVDSEINFTSETILISEFKDIEYL